VKRSSCGAFSNWAIRMSADRNGSIAETVHHLIAS
jgi:hypothetical protein